MRRLSLIFLALFMSGCSAYYATKEMEKETENRAIKEKASKTFTVTVFVNGEAKQWTNVTYYTCQDQRINFVVNPDRRYVTTMPYILQENK